MKKAIMITTITLIFAIALSIFTYNQIVNSNRAGFDEAGELAMAEAGLTEVTDVSMYTRQDTWKVVEGKDVEGTKVFAFVPADGEGEIKVVPAADGLTEQEAKQIFASRNSHTRILSAQLGLENGVPLWEITFINENDSLAYYYLDFKTGEYWGIRVLP